MPIGWTGSAVVGQLDHEIIFALILRNREGVDMSRVLEYCIYLDDLNLFGTSPAILGSLLDAYINRLRRLPAPCYVVLIPATYADAACAGDVVGPWA